MSNIAGTSATDRFYSWPVLLVALVVWLYLLIEMYASIGGTADRPPAISPTGTSAWLAN